MLNIPINTVLYSNLTHLVQNNLKQFKSIPLNLELIKIVCLINRALF